MQYIILLRDPFHYNEHIGQKQKRSSVHQNKRALLGAFRIFPVIRGIFISAVVSAFPLKRFL
jgi:hypothetical protein